ncbi:MAG: signal peptidase I [Gemmatimonadota bacterium]
MARKSTAAVKPKNVVSTARGQQQRTAKKGGSWYDNFKGLVTTVAVFLLLRIFFIEAYRIPSGSMIPSMLIGDWLFVNKLVYGPHVPFTNVNLPGYGEPERYDIAVFVSPPQYDQPEDLTPTLVKRIVGLPADTLYMRDARLFVNGIEQRQGYGAQSVPGDPNEASELFDWQKAVGLQQSRFGPAPDQPTHDNWGPLVVPERHYFMMGDNRYCSKDSRYWRFVPRENLRGRPMFVYYSYRPGISYDPVCSPEVSERPLSFLTDIRWGRIGDRIR